jgi:hypothetical protein
LLRGEGRRNYEQTRLLLVLASLLALSGCAVDQKDMARLMRQEGDYRVAANRCDLFLCGHGDLTSETFEGVKNGQPVKGVVCGGALKAYTIRYQ